MAKLMKYRVLRPHDGDRFYNEGDTRTARDADVKHLIPNVLEEIGPADEAEQKSEAPPLNKAEPAAPANKAITTPRKAKATSPRRAQQAPRRRPIGDQE